MSELTEFAEQILDNVERVIVGKRERIRLLLVALLCEGHVLLEDVPGTGKTMLARAIATSLGLSSRRIQCTPDLLPNDITGVSIYHQGEGRFEFQPGPIFVNILLADEINRATPRTQAALLEGMQEQQVTVDGESRPLPRPFLVLATQNPVEFEGTFPLPEAQLDRFFLRLALGYPAPAEELEMVRSQRDGHPIDSLGQVADGARLPAFAAEVRRVHMDETVEQYLLMIVRATREHLGLALGASPRGTLALYRGAQALAALAGRDHVLPDDVKRLAPYTLTHRLIVRPESLLRGQNSAGILDEIVESTTLLLEEDGAAGRSDAA